MLKRFTDFLGLARPPYRQAHPAPPSLLLTEACIAALRTSLEPERQKHHEGVAYLFGITNSAATLACSVFRPDARTSPGSFEVNTKAMSACVRAAARSRLQVVAQVHTHPAAAFHSDGDLEGARIRYPGYASLVLPDYGRRLPSLDGAAAYLFSRSGQWVELEASAVIVIPERSDG